MTVPVIELILLERIERLERMFERVLDAAADSLGIVLEGKLPDRVQEYLAKGQIEMARIEYRKQTGADLETAIAAVRPGGPLGLEARVNLFLEELKRRRLRSP